MVLIYDIETWVLAGRPNPDLDKLRFFGWLDTDTGRSGMYNFDQKKEIQNLINQSKIIVGFNVEGYDNPILRREGIDLEYKRIIDLYDTVKKRKTLMKLELASYSLKNLAKHFGFEEQKQEQFNYNILMKDKFDDEEINYIWKYLKQDLKVTQALWNYLVDYFSGFKNYLAQKNIDNYSFVSCSGGSLAYKAICNRLEVVEEYNEFLEEMPSYEGGFVSLPTQQMYEENIYSFDFASLYPHMFIQANLYSHSCNCCLKEDKWHGNKVFPDIKGYYCKKELGKIEKVLLELYFERLTIKNKLKTITDKKSDEYKQLDRKQTSLKIIINTMYGISGSPVFKHVYNLDTASDCTYLARQTVKYARNRFKELGYEIIYTDTDSIYLKDVFKNEEELMKSKTLIVNELKKNYPFPQDTFSLEFERRIKKIFFFKKDNGDFAKKFYLFIDENNDVVVKGVPVIKSNASNLSKKIFSERIIPFVKDTGDLLIDKTTLTTWIREELLKDISLAASLIKVNDYTSYKMDSQLQCQIAKLYGAGDHLMIPNYYFGAGVSTPKYCTVEEFKTKNMSIGHVDLSHIHSELEYFCLSDLVNKNVSKVQYARTMMKLKKDGQEQLQKWW